MIPRQGVGAVSSADYADCADFRPTAGPEGVLGASGFFPAQ